MAFGFRGAGVAALLMAGGAAAPAATLKEGYPFTPGDSFTYDYSASQSVQTGCTGTGSVTTQAYREVTTILPATTYSIPPASSVTAYPFHTTGSGTSSRGAITIDNTDYRNFVTKGGPTSYVDYGFVHVADTVVSSKVTDHLSTTRTYLTPFPRDQFPRDLGVTLPLPITFRQITDHHDIVGTNSNILQSNETRSADGAYTDSGMTFDVPYSINQAANGTGTGVEGPANAPETWTFHLPQASAKGDVIPVVATYAGKSGTNLVPDWYPGHGPVPNPLTSSGYLDKGTQSVPAGCGAYAGKPATLLQMTYSDLATVAGSLFSETDAYYVVPNIGRVCVAVTQTQKNYDQEVTGQCSSATTFHSLEGLVSQTLH